MSNFFQDWLIDIEGVQSQFERLLEHIANAKPPLVQFSPRVWAPAVDVYETPEEVVVVAELAGVTPDDIHLQVDAKSLVILGERVDRRPERRRTYHQMEIASGSFQRVISLPAAVEIETAQASFADGFLVVVMPKSKGAYARRVPIVSP